MMKRFLGLFGVVLVLCLIDEGTASISCYECDSVHDDNCDEDVTEAKYLTKCPASVTSCMISKVAYDSGMEIWRRSCASKKNPLFAEKCYTKGAHGVSLKFCPCSKDLCNSAMKY